MELTDKKYKESEVGLIPINWEVKTLGACLTRNPDYGINAPAVPYSDSLPTYIRITDISDDGRFNKSGKVSVNDIQSSNFYLEVGDIVLARTGASVGKSYCYDYNDGALVFAGFLIRIKPDQDFLNPKYLKFFLQSNFYLNWVKENSMRSGQPGINSNEYSRLPIPIPSKSEQTAIATALSDTDALIENLEKLIAKKRNIKQGVMQELLKPKSNWKRKRLGDTCEVFGRIGFRGYTIQDIVPEYEGAISLSPSNILDGELNFNKCTFISWKKYEESPEIKLKVGDIVLVKTASIGKTALVKSLPGKTTLNPQIVVLKNISVNNVFLSYLMGYKYIQDQIKEKVVGGVVPTLSQEQIAGFQIFLPSREEQDYIAYFLSLIDNDIETIKRNLNKYRMIKQGMMQSLLTGKIRLI